MMPMERSWRNAPTIVAGVGELERGGQAGQEADDLRLGHREVHFAHVQERMAEGVDAVAVDVGDGAGGRDVEVAAQQHGADGVAGRELLRRRRFRRWSRWTSRRSAPPRSPWPRRTCRSGSGCPGRSWTSTAARRSASRRSSWCWPAQARPPSIVSNASSDLPSMIALSISAPLMRGGRGHAARRTARPASAILSISSMGVTPAIGSFANCQE